MTPTMPHHTPSHHKAQKGGGLYLITKGLHLNCGCGLEPTDLDCYTFLHQKLHLLLQPSVHSFAVIFPCGQIALQRNQTLQQEKQITMHFNHCFIYLNSQHHLE
ncbi:hypothetical protein TNCT_352651 [Trichonephila clavata]|uniref:Uncharacterized protein n=1 Tax=Trichonephila clavata TaxID=2740835 RepID=A0A8X6KQJ1_TRICU|nr:hypothetical protein TNCT_352651 [Trichonephila clavata]